MLLLRVYQAMLEVRVRYDGICDQRLKDGTAVESRRRILQSADYLILSHQLLAFSK
jgi:hypothetical protein